MSVLTHGTVGDGVQWERFFGFPSRLFSGWGFSPQPRRHHVPLTRWQRTRTCTRKHSRIRAHAYRPSWFFRVWSSHQPPSYRHMQIDVLALEPVWSSKHNAYRPSWFFRVWSELPTTSPRYSPRHMHMDVLALEPVRSSRVAVTSSYRPKLEATL